MSDIIISKKNESTLYIDCEPSILFELKPYFTFKAPGYQFTPKFKAKVWNGDITLLDVRFGTLPIGLFGMVKEKAEKLGYTIEVKENDFGYPGQKDDVTIEDIKGFATSLNIHSNGNPIEVREYQIQSIFNCIYNQRQLSITPTGGGKSLIIYVLYRWYISKGCKHFLLVVPNLGLLRQMLNDFIDYSSHNGYDVVGNSQYIESGMTKDVTKSLVVSTWQSCYKESPAWLNQFQVILGDEAHGYKAEACRNIFERSTNVKYKFGVTGSLDGATVNELTLTGMIGEISKVKSTRDLIEDGHLSDIDIKCLMLKYGKESKKLVRDMEYHQEIDFIIAHDKRNKFIRNLALSLKGNTLVLFARVESHGEILYNLIKEKAVEKKVYFVAGKVEADDREYIRKLVQESTEDSIIVASYGTFSTGVNVPRLHNIIFASPSKSVIRVMQSIGRGLRKSSDKTHLTLYDIVDVINGSKSNPNYVLKHFAERLGIYINEEHEYKLLEIPIE